MSHTILLSGASSGLGREILDCLLDDKKLVIALSRTPSTDWDDPIVHPKLQTAIADFSDPETLSERVDQLLANHSISGIVHCAADYAGTSRLGFSADTNTAFHRSMMVNTIGPSVILRRVLQSSNAQNLHFILNVTSDVVFDAPAGRIAYAAGKTAMQSVILGLSEELATVNVFSVLPTVQVDTPGLRSRRPQGFDFSGYAHAAPVAKGIVRTIQTNGDGLNGAVIGVDDQGRVSEYKSNSGYRPEAIRAYDFRGRYPLELSDRGAFCLAKGLVEVCKNSQNGTPVALGYDARLSSPDLANAFTDGVLSSGVDVISLGLVPSPVVLHAVARNPVSVGVMITASHNPKHWNGIKLSTKHGPMFGDELHSICAAAEGSRTEAVHRGRLHVVDHTETYLNELVSCFDFGKPLKIIWDAGSGAAGPVLDGLVERIPGYHVILHATPDGRFPHRSPDPSHGSALQPLVNCVREQQADIGFSFDCDADRLRVVDDMGNVRRTDTFGSWLMAAIPEFQKILVDCKVGQGAVQHLERASKEVVTCATGHAFLKDALRRLDADGGFEASGHYYFGKSWVHSDDPFYAALKAIELISQQDLPLSSLLFSIQELISIQELRVPCSSTLHDILKDELADEFRDAQLGRIDGLKMTSADGWCLVRKSNSEPVISITAEGSDKLGLDRMMGRVSDVLERHNLVLPDLELIEP